MPKLTDTQILILSRAANRPDNLALPLPEGLHGAAAKMSVSNMIARGWLEEVEANLRRNEPIWRETGDGHGTTLIATAAGLQAIGIEPVVASTVSNLRQTRPDPDLPTTAVSGNASDVRNPVKIRAGTKQAAIIALLQRPEGAAIAEIVAETGWQGHSIRGLISGGLKKKLGLPIASDQDAIRGRVYRFTATG